MTDQTEAFYAEEHARLLNFYEQMPANHPDRPKLAKVLIRLSIAQNIARLDRERRQC